MRKRYQTGSIVLRGTRNPSWYGRFWRDEIVTINGQQKTVRRQKTEFLGTKADFPTKRLAAREFAPILARINANYKPNKKIKLGDFADKWIMNRVNFYKPAGKASTLSNLKIIRAAFGSIILSELNVEMLDRWTSQLTVSPKTINNYIATFSSMWTYARETDYVPEDKKPFEFLKRRPAELKQQPCFTPEQVRLIIQAADEPFKSMFWILAETGMRGGEVCGLYVEDVDFARNIISVRRSAFRSEIQTPKTSRAVRAFPISQALANHVRMYVIAKQAGEVAEDCASPVSTSGLLFSTNGRPYDNGNVCKRALKPILTKLGIDGPRVGLHAFRHGNVSMMSSIGTPAKVQLERIGHADSAMTLRYTHAFSGDHREVADKLGQLVCPQGDNHERRGIDRTDRDLDRQTFGTNSAGGREVAEDRCNGSARKPPTTDNHATPTILARQHNKTSETDNHRVTSPEAVQEMYSAAVSGAD